MIGVPNCTPIGSYFTTSRAEIQRQSISETLHLHQYAHWSFQQKFGKMLQ